MNNVLDQKSEKMLSEITVKSVAELTANDKAIICARRSYLSDEQVIKYDDILTQSATALDADDANAVSEDGEASQEPDDDNQSGASSTLDDEVVSQGDTEPSADSEESSEEEVVESYTELTLPALRAEMDSRGLDRKGLGNDRAKMATALDADDANVPK